MKTVQTTTGKFSTTGLTRKEVASTIMKLAHSLRKRDGLSFADALRTAWNVAKEVAASKPREYAKVMDVARTQSASYVKDRLSATTAKVVVKGNREIILTRENVAQVIQDHFKRQILFHYTYNCSLRTEEAEDLYQELLVTIFEKFHQYKSEYKFTNWFWTIMKRHARNHVALKSYRNGKQTDSYSVELDNDDAAPMIVTTGVTVSDEFNTNERESMLYNAIFNLENGMHRDAILLDLQGYKYEEIARLMYANRELNVQDIKNFILRGKKHLQQSLQVLAA